MNKTTDAEHLKTHNYKNSEKLALRKKYNRLAQPPMNKEESIFKIMDQVPAKKILDVGCGFGDFLVLIRERGFKGELHGIDVSEGILREGIEKNEKENLGINFQVADAQELPFEDESFDIIIAKHMLYHVPDVQKGVDEIHRCLKKGGLFIATLNSKDNKPQMFRFEKIICDKYGLSITHAQALLNSSNLPDYLRKFKDLKNITITREINAPDSFMDYFSTFRDYYEPEPNDKLWAKITQDINKAIKKDIETKGKFIETITNVIFYCRK